MPCFVQIRAKARKVRGVKCHCTQETWEAALDTLTRILIIYRMIPDIKVPSHRILLLVCAGRYIP